MALPVLYKKALKAVWAIYSLAGLITILVAVLVPKKTVLALSPVCYSVKQFGRQCFMCGSTRSFMQAGNANFKAAAQHNSFALILFVAIIVNTIVFIYITTTNNLKHKKP
jgi:hypothetical protein